MGPEMQAKLLRVLEEKEVQRLGGSVNFQLMYESWRPPTESLNKPFVMVGYGKTYISA
jgi:transcriptional regulator with AAA-type ATPase domain